MIITYNTIDMKRRNEIVPLSSFAKTRPQLKYV
jgi:hypothetical protein